MKHLLFIASLVISMATNAQTNYEKGMSKAFDLWKSNNWVEAEQLFERIAAAEPTEWLPNYYIAQMNSLKSWDEKNPDVLKAKLDKAQDYLNTAKALAPNSPEVLVMQATIYTNWIAFDGMTYGMKYSAKVNELYNRAYQIAPNNPMVMLSKAEWNMGSAKYFGQDIKGFCKDVEKAIELFANFKPKTTFHPNWGNERAIEILVTCNE